MDLTIFFIYIGSLLTLSIILVVLVKSLSDGFAIQGKKPVLYGSVSAIIASGAAYLLTWLTKNLFVVYWLLFGIFMIFGIVHVKLVQHKYFYHNDDNKGRVFLGEVFYGLSVVLFAILVFSTLQYFVSKEAGFIFYPMMMSSLGFFVPTLFMKTFDAAVSISVPQYSTWQYPLFQPIELPAEDPREKLLVIGFEIAKKTTDVRKTYFRARAPETIRLGELYYHFMNDYNELQSETPIQFSNGGNQAHEWMFRLKKKWYQRQRFLDPQMSVRENGIRENSVIICERLTN